MFAAGAGPGSGPERKRTVDLGAAVKLIDAARELGVARYVMVSAMGTQDVQNAAEAMQPYLQAKKDADDALMESGLDWTIVRPGRLTDDPGTGTVDAARALGRRGEITRDDTALVLLETLVRPSLARVAFDVLEGPDAGRGGARRAVAPPAVVGLRRGALEGAVQRQCLHPVGATRAAAGGIERGAWAFTSVNPTPGALQMFPANQYVIRLAGDADEAALERLAQLDSAAAGAAPGARRRDRRPRGRRARPRRAPHDRRPVPATAHLRAQLHVRAASFEAAARTPDVADRIRAALRRNRLAHA